MYKKLLTFLLAFILISSSMPLQSAYAATNPIAKTIGNSNPLIDYKLGADPYALVYNGRLYLYLSSDEYEYNSDGSIKENTFSTLKKVVVLSSDDMVNWTEHETILVAGANNLNGGKGIAKWAGNSWAPAAVHKVINGKDKFFLYFGNGGAGIGVLTADSPVGPWTDPLGKALITGNTPGMAGVTWLFDPAVLVDDDGSAYLYCGGGIPNDKDQTSIANPKTARVIKLGADMISTVGSASMIDAPFMFEDSGIHKYNGKYYYSYCINFSGTHPADKPGGEIGYMVSDNPMGPFTYAGTFLKNPYAYYGVGGNNHHAVFEFNKQLYVVYHAQTVSKALLGDGKGYRSPHISKLEYNSDGTIQVVKGDMAGIPQIANLNPYKRVEAETIGWNSGISTEVCQAAGGPTANLDVTNINNGDWIAVSNADFGTSGAKSFKANVASTSSGKIEIRLDKADGTLIGTLDVGNTGGMQSWKTVETNVSSVTGVHRLFFVFTGTGTSNLFNLDYWQFTESGSVDPTPTITPTPTQTPTPTPTPSPRSAFAQIEAESFNDQFGIQTETCTEGGENVGYIENEDYAVYQNIDFGSGSESFQARVASATSGGSIELRLDSINGTLIGYCPITGTGDWQTWADVKCSASGVTGKHDLYLKFTGGSGYLFNLNWFKFTSANISGKLGDLNSDGAIDSLDLVLMKKNLLGLENLEKPELADLDASKTIDAIDFSLLRQYLLGIIKTFPGEIVPTPTPTPTPKPTPTPTATPIPGTKTLLNTYGSLFGNSGSAVNSSQLNNAAILQAIKSQYNSITMENEMKPEAVLSSKLISASQAKSNGYYIPADYTDTTVPTFNFGTMDAVMKICYENGLKLRAHTLVWHGQTPDWFFREGYSTSGAYVSQSVMDARMEMFLKPI